MLKLKLGKKKGEQEGEAGLPVPVDADGNPIETKKKPPLLIIIIAAAVVVLGGGGAAAFFLMKPKPAAEEGAEADAGHEAPKKDDKGGHGDDAAIPVEGAGTIAPGPDGVTFYTLPDLIVNIQAVDGKQTYLKLRLTLEMKDASVATKLQQQHPRMNDMFQSFLRELRPDDLAGSAGSYQLRTEILRRVNLIAAPGKVDAVLIEEMLVQ